MNPYLQLARRFIPVLALVALSQAAQAQAVGTVAQVSGVVSVLRADGSTGVLSSRSQLAPGDTVVTARNSYARILLTDETVLSLLPQTRLKVASYAYDAARPEQDRAVIALERGGFRAVTGLIAKRNREMVRFETPAGSIKPMGTHLGALFCSNDCGGVPTPTGKTPDNGLHVDVASGAVVVTPKLTVALPSSGSNPNPIPTGSAKDNPCGTQPTVPGTGAQTPGGTTGPGTQTPNPTAGPAGGVSPTLPGGTSTPTPTPAPTPGAGAPAPAVVLNAGQFGYLPPPQNSIQPPLVLVPPSLAVQVRMPQSFSQSNPAGSAPGKGSDPECVVQ